MLKDENKALAFLRRYGAALLFTSGLFWLTYTIVFHLRAGHSDFGDHAVWALGMTPRDMLNAFLRGKERIWHILVKLCFLRTKNLWVSAALVTATANAAAYFLVFTSFETVFPQKRPRWLLAALIALVFVANALTAPGAPFVTDRGYVNSWHNPTNIMVRPFAAAVFFMTLRIYNRRRCGEHRVLVSAGDGAKPFSLAERFGQGFREPVYTRAELVLYPLMLLLSVYAKPAFLQYFAPAIFVFLLIDVIRTKGRLLPFCLKLALAYLPAVVVIGSQFWRYFGSFVSVAEAQAAADAVRGMEDAINAGDIVVTNGSSSVNSIFYSSGVAFYYIQTSFSGVGEFLRETGRAVGLTLVVCAFPLAVFAIDHAYARRSAACRLSLIGMLAARLESLFLHELGARESHGNFRWAYFVSIWLLWAVAMERYAERLTEKNRGGTLMRLVATPLLLWHTAVGVIYIQRILTTLEYWF